MPRKTKEIDKKEEPKKAVQKVPTKTTSKKVASKSTTPVKKKVATTKNKTTTSKKSTTTNKKVSTSKKGTTKKATAKVSSTRSKTKKLEMVEYYDLPYRYNQTVVKVLAQTPTMLFIYWDISDEDRKNFEKQYGNDFFQITKPILVIHNKTLNYHFEVEINDFANSWYLQVADSKCDYRIELARKPFTKSEIFHTDYIYIATSNEMEVPNDKILFDSNQKMIYFRNIKTGKETKKQLSSISFLRNMGKIYPIYDLYQAIYPDEKVENIHNNPSSGNLSSKFK